MIHINIKNKDVSTFLFCGFAIFMVINKTYLSFEQKTNKKKNLLDDTFDSVCEYQLLIRHDRKNS